MPVEVHPFSSRIPLLSAPAISRRGQSERLLNNLASNLDVKQTGQSERLGLGSIKAEVSGGQRTCQDYANKLGEWPEQREWKQNTLGVRAEV